MEPMPPPINRVTSPPAGPIVQPGDGSVAGRITPAPAASQPGAFTAQHVAQIAAARTASTKIRRAVSVAKFSGITTAIFAALTLAFSLTSLVGLMLGVGMSIVAIFEFRGAAEITRLDRHAPRRLAINQLMFALMLVLYGAISFYQFKTGPSPLASVASQIGSDVQLHEMLGDYEGIISSVVGITYLAIIVAALVGPGLVAVYYYTRRKYIEQYVTQTPAWILELQRAGMSL